MVPCFRRAERHPGEKGHGRPDIFRCVSLEIANVQLAQSMDSYSRETDGYKAYAVSYMLCRRYGVDAQEYEISKLDGVFQGQVPREDIPAAPHRYAGCVQIPEWPHGQGHGPHP